MKRILILGKTSFVGTSCKQYFDEKYQDEYIVEMGSSRNGEWKKYDFHKYDAVFNTAGMAHQRVSKELETKYYELNTEMPVAMAKKAKADGCKLFIQMSSEIVFGSMGRIGEERIISKNTPTNPVNCYGDSKLQADLQLEKLIDDSFHVAMLRPPLIYSEQVRDGNFPRLLKVAQIIPLFPNIENNQSMIYVYNLAELVRLIIDNWGCGYYYPQNMEYTCTSKFVKDFADAFGHRILMTRFLNPILRVMSKKSSFLCRAFGDLCYDKEMSNHFNWQYCVYSYDESIKIITEKSQKAKT